LATTSVIQKWIPSLQAPVSLDRTTPLEARTTETDAELELGTRMFAIPTLPGPLC
jgi:hypothetical protein